MTDEMSIPLRRPIRNAMSLNRHLLPDAEPIVPAAPTIPPMWGLWLNDPSGWYGPHKPFYEHGATAEAAYASAIARYRVVGTTVDETREPFVLNPAR